MMLSENEDVYVQHVLERLQNVAWASELLHRIEERGGIIPANKPLLFEARFAYELLKRNMQIQYEYPAGVGNSTVEFRISNSMEWLVELVSVCESDGLKFATETNGSISATFLSSSNLQTDESDKASAIERKKQSEEAEMITAQHKIGEKVLSHGQPTKFPCPNTAIHAILVDMRDYLGEGGDVFDYRQIAYGEGGIPHGQKELIHYWEGKPIRGLFEKLDSHPARAAALLQTRIHLLGFIAEKEYRENEIMEKALWLPNPFLVSEQLYDKIKQHSPLWEH